MAFTKTPTPNVDCHATRIYFAKHALVFYKHIYVSQISATLELVKLFSAQFS